MLQYRQASHWLLMQQKPQPLWVSHSSIGDFLSCPRAYYIRHIYRNPVTKNKVNIINPSLALGQVVHLVLESLSTKKAEERIQGTTLMEQYEEAWKSISGERGGFRSPEEEKEYKSRGGIMINRVMFHPGPILNKAVKLVSPDALPPRFYLSDKDDVILCGKIDWLEYQPTDDSVRIIDFKTGMHEEKEDSLQLPIYMLLVKNCQNRNVSGISYWYLEKDNEPIDMPMPDLEKAKDTIMEVALQMKAARLKGEFRCPKNGCFACIPLENIVTGKAKFVGTNDYQDIFINVPSDKPNNYIKEDVEPF